ncbi:hypothetical protein LAZ67_13002930 [Cordylochernes scorpioides]|uniref:Calcium-activated chloride channel N-terminal domain-containing protein n=1 Tax=Cordylochernes scorpioides TaxID=51811 RepID=A0ABY6L8D2_9ARAC|nr:hypothetical protein LAZ67_13002930 [Cordylochernes scorpioides]
MTRIWCGVVVLLLWTTVPGRDSVVLVEEDGGYKNLVVAIDKSVPEDPRLITAIKRDVCSGDVHQRLCLPLQSNKEESILPRGDHLTAQNLVIQTGIFARCRRHVRFRRVDQPNPNFGHDPYTLQPGGCGDPGLYVHFTPDFILGSFNRSMGNIGIAGRQVVHEWAHLRYGVFDEYGIPGDSQYPAFYMEDEESKWMRPTTCNNKIPGWLEGDCAILGNGMVGPKCKFIPDPKTKARASIMYTPDIQMVDSFCEDSEGPLEHNILAPTKQNSRCNYKSTWTIISRHQDFTKLRR